MPRARPIAPDRRRPSHGGTLLASVAGCNMLLAAGPAMAATAARLDVDVPRGFESLAGEQQAVVDVYYGGRRIGQAEVQFQPGRLRFTHVDAVIAMLPDLLDPAAVRQALAADALDTHAELICTEGADKLKCGRLQPAVAGLIFDQDRFRLSLFVSPKYLKVRPATEQIFLPRPDATLSLVDSVAGTIAGGSRGNTLYALQNRAVVGARDVRLISTTSFASNIGFKGDVLAAEVDKPGIRYTAGAFWASGIDLIGRRKLIGASVGSQLDTRSDKDFITGSPLIVSLTQRSRVDILVDGRLASSRTYEAGNQGLDTSMLADGAYEVILRIQEMGGAIREERRFFTKNPRIAPMGQMLWFARGGILADDQKGAFIAPTKTPYAELGIARRLSRHLAVDGTAIATSGKAIVEIGGHLITPLAQVRIAALASTRRDAGLLFQVNSAGASPINFNLDARRIYSHNDQPLVPIGTIGSHANSVGGTVHNAQLAAGTFTQLLGGISYRLPRAQLGVTAFYRKDRGQSANYAIGPTARWSVFQRRGLDITLEGNLSQSNNGRSAYVGVRLQLLGRRSAVGATAGMQTITPRREGQSSGAVSGVQAMYQHENVLGGDLVLAGNIDQTPDIVSAHGRADLRGNLGAVSADIVQQTGGIGTQYSLGFQTAAIVGKDVAMLGGRSQSDSVIAVRLKDAPAKAKFQVIVDETPRGIVRGGETLPVAVTPYRQYDVRIRPMGGELVRFDDANRRVSVYPGNVATLAWTVRSVVAMFGRAVWPDGSPVADADIVAEDAIGHTDQQGYFQIEASPGAKAVARTPDGRSCRLSLSGTVKGEGYTPLGAVPCVTSSISYDIAKN